MRHGLQYGRWGLVAVTTALTIFACADPGGNLIGRRDLVVSLDADGDAWRRDTAPWDPGVVTPSDLPTPPDATPRDDGPSWDPGGTSDPGDAADPGIHQDPGAVDPGQDPGKDSDTGGTTPQVEWVTNQDYLPLLLQRLDDARTSIRVAHLSFGTGATPDRILGALTRAAGRGVSVRVLLESDVDTNPARIQELVSGGVSAKLDGDKRSLHVKAVVVDDRHVLVGSTNWTFASMRYNNEANWAFDDPALGTLFRQWIDGIWDQPGSLRILPEGPYGTVTPIGGGQYLERAGPVIDRATRRVWVTMYQMGWDANTSSTVHRIVTKLANAVGRGIDVRVILEDSDWNDTLDQANREAALELEARGIDVRFETEETTTHSKMVVADDTVVLYSGNWVYSGLESNHEAGAAVASTPLANQAATYFLGIWNSSPATW